MLDKSGIEIVGNENVMITEGNSGQNIKQSSRLQV